MKLTSQEQQSNPGQNRVLQHIKQALYNILAQALRGLLFISGDIKTRGNEHEGNGGYEEREGIN